MSNAQERERRRRGAVTAGWEAKAMTRSRQTWIQRWVDLETDEVPPGYEQADQNSRRGGQKGIIPTQEHVGARLRAVMNPAKGDIEIAGTVQRVNPNISAVFFRDLPGRFYWAYPFAWTFHEVQDEPDTPTGDPS